ncbi:hypothetical protein [Saccharothrix deserti]|uniref:hypothetical protein n=1 Tax=Saccharothrix deserti TaxID=2593674 RepID=UPI00131B9B31|nr:hypothetical protein [Saccharothrix deserti]
MVHSGRRGRLRRRLAGCALAVGLLVACDEGVEPAPFGQAGDAPAPRPDRDGTGGKDGTGGTDGFAWVPFGAGDPQDPTPDWPFYNALASHDCAALRDNQISDDPLSAAAVAVCAAAVDGEEGQWERARAALASGGSSGFSIQCIEDSVRDLVRRAIAWHDSHPGVRPVLQYRSVSGTTECGQPETTTSETTTSETTTSETTTSETTTSETTTTGPTTSSSTTSSS